MMVKVAVVAVTSYWGSIGIENHTLPKKVNQGLGIFLGGGLFVSPVQTLVLMLAVDHP